MSSGNTGDSNNRSRSPLRSPATGTGKKSYIRRKDGSPVRHQLTKAKDILGMADDALEHGPTEEAKQLAATERARSKSPIPKGSSSKISKLQELENKKRLAAEDEARRRRQKEREEQDKANALEQKRKEKESATEKKLPKKKDRVTKVPESLVRPHAPQRVPKRSALLALGGKEAEAYKQQKEAEALATWEDAKSDGRWKIVQETFDGLSASDTKAEEAVDWDGSSESMLEATKVFETNPEKYVAMYYSTVSGDDSKITYILREGTTGYRPEGCGESGGKFKILQHKFQRLDPLPGGDNLVPWEDRDEYTDEMTHQGKDLHDDKTNIPILPCRGMGIADSANMTFIGSKDNDDDTNAINYDPPQPADIFQGTSIGNCWLLSAIACLADFDFAIERLFRKTPRLFERPFSDEVNQYIVTLWDLKTWSEVDIVVDERLALRPPKGNDSLCLLGAKPSCNKLWVPYLEKALSIHCGGWDKLEGGQCTAAWPMLTGSRNQYLISKNTETNKYLCAARFDPNVEKWTEHSNSPQDSDPAHWRVDWPKVGGGGNRDLELSDDQLFDRIVAWDEHNFLVGAGTDGRSDTESTEGVVDNHAYSVIDTRKNICDTGVDLLLVRNPWGKGGDIQNGEFVRSGPGWDRYPEIRKELNPIMEDNGLFWVTKTEFFRYFPTIYLCKMDMTRLQDKNYVNDLEDEFERGKNNKQKKKPVQQEDDYEIVPLNINTDSDPNFPYKVVKQQYNGGVTYNKMKKDLKKGLSLVKAVEEFKVNPEKYLAIHYQTSTVDEGWPDEVHQFTYVYREGTEGMEVEGIAKEGKRTILTNVLR